jgi:hypothetical protein
MGLAATTLQQTVTSMSDVPENPITLEELEAKYTPEELAAWRRGSQEPDQGPPESNYDREAIAEKYDLAHWRTKRKSDVSPGNTSSTEPSLDPKK